jgi:hypothetical protein
MYHMCDYDKFGALMQKLGLNFADKWRSSEGIIPLRTRGHGVCLLSIKYSIWRGYIRTRELGNYWRVSIPIKLKLNKQDIFNSNGLGVLLITASINLLNFKVLHIAWNSKWSHNWKITGQARKNRSAAWPHLGRSDPVLPFVQGSPQNKNGITRFYWEICFSKITKSYARLRFSRLWLWWMSSSGT